MPHDRLKHSKAVSITLAIRETLRRRAGDRWLEWAARGIRQTPVMKVAAGSKTAELHTMLGHQALAPYAIALKSLLRFLDRSSLGVTVHSDGTLTAADTAVLNHHFPGIRVIDARAADERCLALFGQDSPHWRHRSRYFGLRRLMDTQIWRDADRIMNFDSDILCLNPPAELQQWLSNGHSGLLIGQTNGSPSPEKLNGTKWEISPHRSDQIQSQILSNLPELAGRMGLPVRFLDGASAGLHCHTTELRLERTIEFLQHCEQLRLPLGQWGTEQSVVVFLLSASGASRLDPRFYFNFFPDCEDRLGDAKVVHFIGLRRYHRWRYPRLAVGVVASLSSRH